MMDRREVLSGGVLLAAAAMANAPFAADEPMHDHEHHHHDMPLPAANLLTSVSDCLLKGQICSDHCLVSLGDGDKAMAACAQSVAQMMATCGALQKLASSNSKYLPQMAKLARDVCKDCEAECKKHADKHKQCKDCQESCAACAKECEKFST
jgi:Cys-rich four helix bundle protein (predicted Tat secretion target)